MGARQDAGDRRDIADEIEIKLVVERRVDRVCRTDQEERVAVGGARTTASVAILVPHPAGFRRRMVGQAAPTAIGRSGVRRCRPPAGGKANNDPHRPRRIGLRPCDPRYRWQRGSTRGQMQKSCGGKVSWRPSIGAEACESAWSLLAPGLIRKRRTANITWMRP